MRGDNPLADAVGDFLFALDGGYFHADAGLLDSAFVLALRHAYTEATGKTPWPRMHEPLTGTAKAVAEYVAERARAA